MKQKTTIIFGLVLIFMVSCQHDIVPDINPDVYGDEVPVKFSFSMKPEVFYGTDYEPMSRAEGDDLPLVQISNNYRVLISKKVGNRWILEKILLNRLPGHSTNQSVVRIMDDKTVFAFETDLRPGSYRMTVITGYNSMNWEKFLLPGFVVEDENGNVRPVCTYRIIENGYLHPGEKHLQEEIFSGCEPFEVVKTEDLHTPSPNQNVHVKLERKVTKFRIFLKNDIVNGNELFKTHQNGIAANLKVKPGSRPFANGLNAWGEVYFDNNDVLDNMIFGAFTWKEPQTARDNQTYLLPMRNYTRQFSIFYFLEREQEIPVEVSNIEVTVSSQINVNYVYAFPEAEKIYTGSPFEVTLKHNTQHGIVLKPGGESWSDPRDASVTVRNLILDADGNGNPVDHSDLFPYSYEYDLTPRPN